MLSLCDNVNGVALPNGSCMYSPNHSLMNIINIIGTALCTETEVINWRLCYGAIWTNGGPNPLGLIDQVPLAYWIIQPAPNHMASYLIAIKPKLHWVDLVYNTGQLMQFFAVTFKSWTCSRELIDYLQKCCIYTRKMPVNHTINTKNLVQYTQTYTIHLYSVIHEAVRLTADKHGRFNHGSNLIYNKKHKCTTDKKHIK